jgi:hypothetical protein
VITTATRVAVGTHAAIITVDHADQAVDHADQAADLAVDLAADHACLADLAVDQAADLVVLLAANLAELNVDPMALHVDPADLVALLTAAHVLHHAHLAAHQDVELAAHKVLIARR